MKNLKLISILLILNGLSNLANGQVSDCDAFGGCYCSTDKRSNLYLSWIAPDVGDYALVCDPHYFGLRLEGDSIHVKEDFNSLVVIPLHNDPLNFKIVGQDDQMTTLRCLSFAQQSKENSLVQKDSSVKKSPMIVQALSADANLDYHVFVVQYNTTLQAWTQMPRSLCRHDIKNPEFACLPIDCNDCDPTTNDASESEKIADCKALKAQYWNEES